jgi:hypothetical protein
MNFWKRYILLLTTNTLVIGGFFLVAHLLNWNLRSLLSTRISDLDVSKPADIKILLAFVGGLFSSVCANMAAFSVGSYPKLMHGARARFQRQFVVHRTPPVSNPQKLSDAPDAA